MEQAVQNYKSGSLMEELSSWNQQESQFRNLFSDRALQDREFLKMKLKEFDRIWYKHNGQPQSAVEKALMMMMNYQRRNLQKSLYPGILTRLLVRAFTFSTALIKQSLTARPEKKTPLFYAAPIPVPQPPKQENQEKAQGQNAGHSRKQHQQRTQRPVNKRRWKKTKGRSI